MPKNETRKIVNFLYEMGTAKNIVRSHNQTIRGANDTIAAHSFRVAIIGLILAELEKADKDKVLKICLLHDLAEVRTGDANFINKHYRTEDEEKAIEDQWKDIAGGKEIIFLLEEYGKRESKESIVAKDADILDQIILQKEYLSQSPFDLNKWHKNAERKIKTKSALKIAGQIFKTGVMDWIYDFEKSAPDLNNRPVA